MAKRTTTRQTGKGTGAAGKAAARGVGIGGRRLQSRNTRCQDSSNPKHLPINPDSILADDRQPLASGDNPSPTSENFFSGSIGQAMARAWQVGNEGRELGQCRGRTSELALIDAAYRWGAAVGTDLRHAKSKGKAQRAQSVERWARMFQRTFRLFEKGQDRQAAEVLLRLIDEEWCPRPTKLGGERHADDGTKAGRRTALVQPATIKQQYDSIRVSNPGRSIPEIRRMVQEQLQPIYGLVGMKRITGATRGKRGRPPGRG